jgi:UDP-glucose 4-epimerase
MNDTVLVTGSSGMIGTALVERLLKEGATVHGVSRSRNRWAQRVEDRTVHVDLSDPQAVEQLPPDTDTIVHLAAASRVPAVVEDPTLARANIETTTTVLEHARAVGADLIFASSREVYGEYDGNRRAELGVDVRAARDPYAASKAAGEALVESYDACYESVRTATLRLTNVYGRYDASDRVVPTFVACASRGDELTIYGNPMVRGFLHIDDCVEAFTRTVESFERVRGHALNVGSDRAYSLLDVAEEVVIAANSGSTITVEGDRNRRGDRYVLDTSAIESTFGWEPEHGLASGIEETVAWYLDRPNLLEEIG